MSLIEQFNLLYEYYVLFSDKEVRWYYHLLRKEMFQIEWAD